MAEFIGEVRTEWLRHAGVDRKMKLVEDFAFIDDNNIRWDAPAGSIVDGASIPELLWSSLLGTPYVGDYRRATVLHDVACQERTRPHKDVHRMFYDAMRKDGVSEGKAQQMYTAVRLFGPKWTIMPAGAAGAPQAAAAVPQKMSIEQLESALDAALNE